MTDKRVADMDDDGMSKRLDDEIWRREVEIDPYWLCVQAKSLPELRRFCSWRLNRLKKLAASHVPEIIIVNERRMLIECVDYLLEREAPKHTPKTRVVICEKE